MSRLKLKDGYTLTREDKDIKAIQAILTLKAYCEELSSNDDGLACKGCEFNGNQFCFKYFKKSPADWKTRGYKKGKGVELLNE